MKYSNNIIRTAAEFNCCLSIFNHGFGLWSAKCFSQNCFLNFLPFCVYLLPKTKLAKLMSHLASCMDQVCENKWILHVVSTDRQTAW